MYHIIYIYISMKSRSKNYEADAVVWSRTNLENSTNPRGTVHDDRGTMYQQPQTTRHNKNKHLVLCSRLFVGKSMWERTKLRYIHHCAIVEAAGRRGTNQLHGWVLRGRVLREALAAGKKIADNRKLPNAGRDRAVIGITRPMHSTNRKKTKRRRRGRTWHDNIYIICIL